MAEVKKYIVKTNDPTYCGVGAGGVQFAYGQAEVNEGWVCDWFKERGYTVIEKIDAEVTEAPVEAKAKTAKAKAE